MRRRNACIMLSLTIAVAPSFIWVNSTYLRSVSRWHGHWILVRNVQFCRPQTDLMVPTRQRTSVVQYSASLPHPQGLCKASRMWETQSFMTAKRFERNITSVVMKPFDHLCCFDFSPPLADILSEVPPSYRPRSMSISRGVIFRWGTKY